MNLDEKFVLLEPDENYDWINQGDKKFRSYMSVGTRSKNELQIFNTYTSPYYS
jgi:predicted helicase